MSGEKYALLDTDFVSKTHLIRKDESNKLIDIIMDSSDYKFYCHEQIKIEITRHNIGESSEWLNKMISSGRIKCVTDEDILNKLYTMYFDSAPKMFADMLESGCEAYRRGYFEEHFRRVNAIDYLSISKEEFLNKLREDCDDIGPGNNLGELKSYILLQTMTVFLGENVYVFCSDDKNARNGIVSLGGAKCISVLSVFYKLYKNGVLEMEAAQPYIESYLDFCESHDQINFKVYENTKESRLCSVPCEQVFREIYEEKFVLLQNGCLKYK